MDGALGPSSFVILGIAAAAGPLTAYDLKSTIGRTVGFLWPFAHAQVYKEAARLAAMGLLAEEQEAGGRRRRRYAVTAEGRSELARWLATGTDEPAQLRDPGLLRLAFASLAGPGDLERLCAGQVRLHRARLAGYEALADVPMDPYLRATLEFGLRHEALMVTEWERLAARDGNAGAA